MDQVPMHRLWTRLLNEEQHTLGLKRGNESDQHIVTWLRIFGDADIARRNRTALQNKPLNTELSLPPGTLRAVFGDAPDEAASMTIDELANSIRSNPDQLEAFMRTTPSRMAAALHRFPRSSQLLSVVSEKESDPAVRAHVDAISVALQQLEQSSSSTAPQAPDGR